MRCRASLATRAHVRRSDRWKRIRSGRLPADLHSGIAVKQRGVTATNRERVALAERAPTRLTITENASRQRSQWKTANSFHWLRSRGSWLFQPLSTGHLTPIPAHSASATPGPKNARRATSKRHPVEQRSLISLGRKQKKTASRMRQLPGGSGVDAPIRKLFVFCRHNPEAHASGSPSHRRSRRFCQLRQVIAGQGFPKQVKSQPAAVARSAAVREWTCSQTHNGPNSPR